eukprot:TRINITY_DN831_c0_g1_i2.p1 TRINITY_DN831_c0_g1~~TRINITY_DN831_c0_g1_i2.p1  ORF type:complete len:110 (+),score=18.30 TRINITY_DN831_c0_g1_i2:131-460(+)
MMMKCVEARSRFKADPQPVPDNFLGCDLRAIEHGRILQEPTGCHDSIHSRLLLDGSSIPQSFDISVCDEGCVEGVLKELDGFEINGFRGLILGSAVDRYEVCSGGFYGC